MSRSEGRGGARCVGKVLGIDWIWDGLVTNDQQLGAGDGYWVFAPWWPDNLYWRKYLTALFTEDVAWKVRGFLWMEDCWRLTGAWKELVILTFIEKKLKYIEQIGRWLQVGNNLFILPIYTADIRVGKADWEEMLNF